MNTGKRFVRLFVHVSVLLCFTEWLIEQPRLGVITFTGLVMYSTASKSVSRKHVCIAGDVQYCFKICV